MLVLAKVSVLVLDNHSRQPAVLHMRPPAPPTVPLGCTDDLCSVCVGVSRKGLALLQTGLHADETLCASSAG